MVGDLSHVCNRGIAKGKIFLCDDYYLRFVEGLYRFNNLSGAIRVSDGHNIFTDLPAQEKLVDIFKWSLLPNHYHLFLYEQVDGGITEFVKRVGNGFTKYFNIRNERSGYLFQNAAKIVSVTTDKHFLYLPFYIDLNPVELFEPRWEETGVKNVKKVMDFLISYRWSSYADYAGRRNFPWIINKGLFYRLFDTNEVRYQQEIVEWLKNYPVLSNLPC